MRFVCAVVVMGLASTAFAAKKPVETVGKGAQFATVQAAVDAAPEGGAVLRIAPGTYREKLHIDKAGIELRGTGAKPDDTLLVYGDSADMAGGTGKSGSVSVSGDDFYAENLTIQNDWEKVNGRVGKGTQAVALLLTSDKAVLRHVRLLGYQDTLYASSKACHANYEPGAANPPTECHASRQLFEDCYIEGHVDYIFGDAKAVFKNCELHGMSHSIVTITAQSKMYPAEDSGYLFLDCTITSEKGVDKLSFGRPWRAYSKVWFVNTTVKDATLDPPGWMEWAGKLATSDYAEFGTKDGAGKPVDVNQRIAPSRQLTAAEAKVTVKSWLGGWDAEAVH